ncbi:hypothetical protein GCM10014719_39390 [Planomonospora parontospora subsp. antibiotica]|nr:hypothetical protein GCM10014719_39390 [Planomonospora parontospora subsp. antibiotica]GII17068.1 hypothetical protein Ppa05_37940 [Planomonospora parontospora subsp. antibiotica]
MTAEDGDHLTVAEDRVGLRVQVRLAGGGHGDEGDGDDDERAGPPYGVLGTAAPVDGPGGGEGRQGDEVGGVGQDEGGADEQGPDLGGEDGRRAWEARRRGPPRASLAFTSCSGEPATGMRRDPGTGSSAV